MGSEFPEFEHIKYERDGDILFLIFNRPEKLNAVNRTLHNELVPAITWAEHDPDSKVIVFTGAGRGFCAGGDVAGQAGQAEECLGHREQWQFAGVIRRVGGDPPV